MLWILLIPVVLYSCLLLYLTGKLVSVEQFIPEKKSFTRVTIVVACRNEEAAIPYLLSDIIAQDHPAEQLEVIIVDDGSEDNTFALASSYRQISNLKVIRNNGQGKKSAIRTGIEAAESDLIVTTDADCRLNRKWISTIASFYDKHKPDLIIGPVMIDGTKGFSGKFQELEFLSLQAITAATAASGDPVMCNGANLAFSWQTWRRHNSALKPEILSGDDIFLLHSIKKEKDSKILWLESPDAVVRTNASDSLRSFIRQRARWISKSSSIEDRYTRTIGIVTFVTIIEILVLLVAGLFDPLFFRYFLGCFGLKAIADLMILSEITRRRKQGSLMLWYIPAQIVYPLYVIAVWVYSFFRKNKW